MSTVTISTVDHRECQADTKVVKHANERTAERHILEKQTLMCEK